MSAPRILGLACLAALAGRATPATAEILSRFDRTLPGDFVIIGSTIGSDCDAPVPLPPRTTRTCPGLLPASDTGADAFWVDNDASGGPTTAARTSATLTLPGNATVVRAQLYWAGLVAGAAGDDSAHIDRPDGASVPLNGAEIQVITFPSGLGMATAYQATAEVTSLVQTLRSGAYRVSGIDVRIEALLAADDEAFGGWVLVVFYERPGAPLRRVSLLDGLTAVAPNRSVAATLRGLSLGGGGQPVATLGAWGFEGDSLQSGDRITVDNVVVSDSLVNPSTNFFNGSRSAFGREVPGLIPAVTGLPDTLAGVDLDVVDISAQLNAATTEILLGASTTDDNFYLGGLVTSIGLQPPPVDAAPEQDAAPPQDSEGPPPDAFPNDSPPPPDAAPPDAGAPGEEGDAGPRTDASNTGARDSRAPEGGTALRTVLGGSGCACTTTQAPASPSPTPLLITLATLTLFLRRRR